MQVTEYQSYYPKLKTNLGYRWFTPEPEQLKKVSPLKNKTLILMHGRGDNLESYQTLAKEINLTSLNYLLLNGPNSANSVFMTGYSWYEYPFNSPHPDLDLAQNEINKIISQLIKAYAVKPSDIIVGGFSQGATMAINTWLTESEELGGFMALSPRSLIPTNFWKKQRIKEKVLTSCPPFLLGHGRNDEVLPFSESLELYETLLNQGSNIKWHEFDGGHEIDIETLWSVREWLESLI